MVAVPNILNLPVEVSLEDGRWVARQPAFGLVAAHPDKNTALVRMQSLILAQLAYGFNHDKGLSELVVNGDDDLADRLRQLRSSRRPIALTIEAGAGSRFEYCVPFGG